MNYIDRLVAELCPDGVDFYTIDELITLEFGTRITKSKDAGTIYPVYGGGGASFRTDNYNREDKYVVSRFAMSEKCVRYVSGKFWMLDSGFTYSVKDESLLSYKYISYWLLNAQQEIYACSSQSAQRNLKTADFKRFEVPVPPVEIQEAIVEILDKFTNLEAELEAELEARTLQYEYYRDLLLASFSEPTVKFYPIEELFTTRNGYTPSKSNSSYWENGTVPWFRMEDIRENGGILSESLQSVHESALKKGGMFPAGSIIVATSATIGEHALINVDFLCNQRFTVLTPKEEFKSLLLPKFLYYYSFVLDRWCLSNTTQSSFASVDMKRFKKFEFPVPSLEEQQRIVDILDRFDSLTTSLSEGLPAELAARRSQYEYYRDQLLTFPRKGDNQ